MRKPFFSYSALPAFGDKEVYRKTCKVFSLHALVSPSKPTFYMFASHRGLSCSQGDLVIEIWHIHSRLAFYKSNPRIGGVLWLNFYGHQQLLQEKGWRIMKEQDFLCWNFQWANNCKLFTQKYTASMPYHDWNMEVIIDYIFSYWSLVQLRVFCTKCWIP